MSPKVNGALSGKWDKLLVLGAFLVTFGLLYIVANRISVVNSRADSLSVAIQQRNADVQALSENLTVLRVKYKSDTGKTPPVPGPSVILSNVPYDLSDEPKDSDTALPMASHIPGLSESATPEPVGDGQSSPSMVTMQYYIREEDMHR
jgi:hypothetical protein